MKGFYVYCIHEANARPRQANLKGIEFGGRISAVPFKDIEAIVSDIDLFQFNASQRLVSLGLKKKINEKNIRCHHNVVAKAFKTGTVIPMKFGTIFKTKKSLDRMLKTYYRKFKGLFANLNNKQEWGVKAYLEYEKFVEFLKKQNKEVKKLEERKLTMPEGMQWYVDRKIDEFIASRFEEEIEKQLQGAVKRLGGSCEQIVLCDLLPKEATGPGKDNVFNAACLVDNNKLDVFKKLLQGLEKEYDQIGGRLIVTGPWPPYNFVELKNDKR